jgi:CBS domain-containing protein
MDTARYFRYHTGEEQMKVKDLMTKKVITLTPDDQIDRLFFLFNFENIRHVPVITEKGVLVGIVSDRDLKKVLGPPKKKMERPDGSTIALSTGKVRNIMRREPYTVAPEASAADAAAIMSKKKIGALPVVTKGKLVGIITSTDILRAFVKLCNIVESFTESSIEKK